MFKLYSIDMIKEDSLLAQLNLNVDKQYRAHVMYFLIKYTVHKQFDVKSEAQGSLGGVFLKILLDPYLPRNINLSESRTVNINICHWNVFTVYKYLSQAVLNMMNTSSVGLNTYNWMQIKVT